MMIHRIVIMLAAVLMGAAAAVSGRPVGVPVAATCQMPPCPSGFSIEDGILTVGDTVTVIAAYAFADRDDIVAVRCVPESRLREVGEYAFLGCRNLKSVDLPATVSVLGEGCLRECGALRSFEVPDSVTALPKYLFAWDGALKSVTLPLGLRDIGSHSFAYCVSLLSVAGPLTTVDAGAGISVNVIGMPTQPGEGVMIPDGVTHIGSNAFAECRALRQAVLPSSVTELESYAFAECVSLREAVLPANDALLGELIFSGCRSLTALYEYSPVPPRFDCDSYIFEPDETALYRQCRLVTLPESARAYAAASGWSLFHEP